jgi:hypothetical protein
MEKTILSRSSGYLKRTSQSYTRSQNSAYDQKVFGLHFFLCFIALRWNVADMSGRVPACPPSSRPRCSHLVWSNHRKEAIIFVLCILFVMSESNEQRGHTRLCAKLEKRKLKVMKFLKLSLYRKMWAVRDFLSGSSALNTSVKFDELFGHPVSCRNGEMIAKVHDRVTVDLRKTVRK